MSTEPHTLSGAFVLDALSPEEAEQFRRHLQSCAVCREEVRELREAAARLGAVEAIAPPLELKTRVLAAADRTPQKPPRLGSSGTTPAPRRWAPRVLAAAAASTRGAQRLGAGVVPEEPRRGGFCGVRSAAASTRVLSSRGGAIASTAPRRAAASRSSRTSSRQTAQDWRCRRNCSASSGLSASSTKAPDSVCGSVLIGLPPGSRGDGSARLSFSS